MAKNSYFPRYSATSTMGSHRKCVVFAGFQRTIQPRPEVTQSDGGSLQQQPASDVTFIGPNIFLINHKQEQLELTKEEVELLRTRILDADVDDMTKPLDNERVAVFELKANKKPITRVTKDDREFLIHTEKNVTTSKDDVWMEDIMVECLCT